MFSRGIPAIQGCKAPADFDCERMEIFFIFIQTPLGSLTRRSTLITKDTSFTTICPRRRLRQLSSCPVHLSLDLSSGLAMYSKGRPCLASFRCVFPARANSSPIWSGKDGRRTSVFATLGPQGRDTQSFADNPGSHRGHGGRARAVPVRNPGKLQGLRNCGES